MLPPASRLLRLLAFAVPALLAVCAVQPLVAALVGAADLRWALYLGAPCLAGASVTFVAARITDRGDALQPPWYSAYALAPGAFLMAGAASMCIYGAILRQPAIALACGMLLIPGALLWTVGLWWVRWAAR